MAGQSPATALRELHHRLDDGREVRARLLKHELVLLQLREVEDVVDEVREAPTARGDHAEVALRAVVEVRLFLEHFRETDDAVQRRAQLVGGVREELVFEHVHALLLFEGALRRLEGQLLLAGDFALEEVDAVGETEGEQDHLHGGAEEPRVVRERVHGQEAAGHEALRGHAHQERRPRHEEELRGAEAAAREERAHGDEVHAPERDRLGRERHREVVAPEQVREGPEEEHDHRDLAGAVDARVLLLEAARARAGAQEAQREPEARRERREHRVRDVDVREARGFRVKVIPCKAANREVTGAVEPDQQAVTHEVEVARAEEDEEVVEDDEDREARVDAEDRSLVRLGLDVAARRVERAAEPQRALGADAHPRHRETGLRHETKGELVGLRRAGRDRVLVAGDLLEARSVGLLEREVEVVEAPVVEDEEDRLRVFDLHLDGDAQPDVVLAEAVARVAVARLEAGAAHVVDRGRLHPRRHDVDVRVLADLALLEGAVDDERLGGQGASRGEHADE
jgi:hypothetical protein